MQGSFTWPSSSASSMPGAYIRGCPAPVRATLPRPIGLAQPSLAAPGRQSRPQAGDVGTTRPLGIYDPLNLIGDDPVKSPRKRNRRLQKRPSTMEGTRRLPRKISGVGRGIFGS